jgi:nucleoid-associated protein EbfC
MSKGGKRGFGGGGGGLPGGFQGGMGGMMKQIQKMQEDMVTAQEALANETFEVSVGGGAIKVVISGHQRVQSVSINKDMIDTNDPEWLSDLQDLLVLATNQAIEHSQTQAAQRMEQITGGMGSNPLLNNLLGG